MTQHDPSAESTAAALYVAMELSAKEWLLTMSTAPEATRRRARVRPGDRAAVERVVADAKAAAGRWRRTRRCGAATKRAATDFGRIGC